MITENVYRMYSLVVRQLSSMQKGVQTAHAVANYGLYHSDEKDWKQWASEDQTLIILDGGTAPELEQIENHLSIMNVTHENFYEPDLNDMMTSIVFLVPEQVWDRENYLDFEDYVKAYIGDEINPKADYNQWVEYIGGETNVFLRALLSSKRLAQ